MAQSRLYNEDAKLKNEINLVLFGAALVTIFFKTDFYDPFNSAKLIILLLIAGWTVGNLATSYRTHPLKFGSKEFITFLLLSGFILSLIASTISTSPLIVAFLGETQRRNGLLAYLGLGVIFLYLSRVMNLSSALRIYKIGIITGVTVSFYGFMQINGKDFVKWNNPYNVMVGTLGNPNFASAVIALLVLVGFYGILLRKLPRPYKYLSGLLIIFGMISIIVSESRQGLFVILFSLFFYVSIYSFLINKKIGFSVILLCAFSSIVVIFGMLQKGPLASLVYKQSVTVRGYYWRAGIEMFKESPIFGVGMDRYGAYFKQFREVGYPLYAGYEISSTNAHNIFIQFFATAGFFAGVFYLALAAYILFYGIKTLKNLDSENQKLALGLLSVWIGFHAQSLISIDNLGVSIWGWVLGGTLLGIINNLSKDKIGMTDRGSSTKTSRRVKINIFQPTVSVVSIILVSVIAIPIYNMERNLFALVSMANPALSQNKDLILIKAEDVINSKLADPFYKYRSIVVLYEMGYTKRALEAFSDLYRTDPRNPDFLKGKIFFESALNDSAKLIETRLLLSEVDPWNAINYLELLVLYKSNNDLTNAGIMKDKIFSFTPKSEIADKAVEILE